MKNVNVRSLHTERLDLRIPTINEQRRLWLILCDDNVNKLYMPTPGFIFKKNDLDKTKLEDCKKARKLFLERLNNWKIQAPFYVKKIESITNGEDSNKFTWSVFLKDTDIVIGQVTCQPKDDYPEDIRDVGWYIDPKFQGHGYASEAAEALFDYMFNEVVISDIYTGAEENNPKSWGIMEKNGFEFIGLKQSPYFDDDKFLNLKEYHGTKELFNNRNKEKGKGRILK